MNQRRTRRPSPSPARARPIPFFAVRVLTGVVCGLVLGGGPLLAQRAPATARLVERPAAAPESLTLGEWFVAEVARRWAVEPTRVEVEWSATPVSLRDRPSVGAELDGGASDLWVVSVPPSVDDGERRVRVRAGVRRATPVATRDLARGTLVGEADLAWADRLVWGPPGPAPADPVGLEVQRRIATGEALTAPAVQPGPVVASRQPVEVVFRKGRVTIALRGTALADGIPGERIHVRLEDGRRVAGRAIGPGRVALDAGGDR